MTSERNLYNAASDINIFTPLATFPIPLAGVGHLPWSGCIVSKNI